MYLNELTKEEKELFLQLAYSMAKADGIYEEEERMLMEAYSKECGITFNEPQESYDVTTLLRKLSNSPSKIRRIILLEIIAMALVDTRFEEEEKELVNEIAKNFNISKEDTEKAINICDDYLNIGRILTNFVEEGK